MAAAANDNYQINIGADNSQLKKKIKDSLEEIDKLGISGAKAANDILSMGEGALGAKGSILMLGAALGGITAAAAGFAFITNDINETRKSAQEARMGIEEFSKVFQVLGSSVDQNELGGMLKDWQEKLGEAVQGSGSLYEQLNQLGISASSLVDLHADEALAKYYYSAKNAGTGTQEMVFRMEEAGGNLSSLISTFEQYSSETEYLQAVQSKTAKYTQEQAEQFQALEKSGKNLASSLLNLASGPATMIADFFTTLVNAAAEAVQALDSVIDKVDDLRTAFSSKIKVDASLFDSVKSGTELNKMYASAVTSALADTGYKSADELKKRIDQLKNDPAVQAAMTRTKTAQGTGYDKYRSEGTSNYDYAKSDPANILAQELSTLETRYATYTQSIQALEQQKTDKLKQLQGEDRSTRAKQALDARTAQEIHADSSKALLAEYQAQQERIKVLYASDTAEQQKQLDIQTKIYQSKKDKADAALKQAEDQAKKSSSIKKSETTELQRYADELKKLGVQGEDFTKAITQKEIELRLSNSEKVKSALNLKQSIINEHWAAVTNYGSNGLEQIHAQNQKEQLEYQKHFAILEQLGESTAKARADLSAAQNQRVQDYINQQIDSSNSKDLIGSIKSNPGDFSSTQVDKIMQDQSTRTGITDVDPLAELQLQQQSEMDLVNALHEQKLLADEEYFQRKSEIEDAYTQKSQALQLASLQTNMSLMQQSADNMYSSMSTAFGKSSRATRAAFIMSKTAAIGSSLLNIYQWATSAASQSGLAGMASYASVVSQIGTIIGSMKSIAAPDIAQFHDGYSNVKETGSYYLQSGERVLSRDTNADLKGFLSEQNRQSSSNTTVQANTIIQGSVYGDQGIVDAMTRNRVQLLPSVNKAKAETS